MKQLIDYIEFIRARDIEDVLRDECGKVKDFKLKAGADRFRYLTDGELKLTVKPKEKDGNWSYDVDLKCYAEVSAEDVEALNDRMVVAGISDEQRMYWIGSLDFPVRLALVPDLNSCGMNVSCECLTPIF